MHVIWQAEEAACCQSESAGLLGPYACRPGPGLGPERAASSPTVLGSSVSMMLAPRARHLLEQARESQGLQPQEPSQSLEAAMASSTRGEEISTRQRSLEHPAPSVMPCLPVSPLSGTRTRRAGWHRGWSLPRRWPQLPQPPKPPYPSA